MQRFVDGNTLIAESNAGCGFEVTAQAEVMWEYRASRNPLSHPHAFRLERVPLDGLPQ